MNNRAQRRALQERVIARVRRRLRENWPGGETLAADPGFVGHLASTHMRPCSCWLCRGESYDRQEAVREARAEMTRE